MTNDVGVVEMTIVASLELTYIGMSSDGCLLTDDDDVY